MFQSFNTTGIGSLPHTDPVEACRVIFDHIDIPFWPQLPHRSFNELMVPQYSEGFPFVTIEGEDVTVKKPDEAELAAFYEAVANKSGFPISKEYAAGFYAFVDMLKEKGIRVPEDVAIISRGSSMQHQFLATTEEDYEEIGKTQAKLILRTLEDGKYPDNKNYSFHSFVVPRGSCKRNGETVKVGRGAESNKKVESAT